MLPEDNEVSYQLTPYEDGAATLYFLSFCQFGNIAPEKSSCRGLQEVRYLREVNSQAHLYVHY